LKKIIFFLYLLSFDSIAKEKFTGMLGANLGDNIIQAIGKENYSKHEVNYDPKFKKDYQQFEYLTSDNYAVQIFSERKSKKIVYFANIFATKNTKECVKQRNQDIIDVQKKYILPPRRGQEVGNFGTTTKDLIAFGDEEMIVNFSCITIPNADPNIKDQYRIEVLTRKFNTFLATAK